MSTTYYLVQSYKVPGMGEVGNWRDIGYISADQFDKYTAACGEFIDVGKGRGGDILRHDLTRYRVKSTATAQKRAAKIVAEWEGWEEFSFNSQYGILEPEMNEYFHPGDEEFS